MPVSLAALTSQTEPITLTVGGAQIHATYYAQRISGADIKRLFSLREALEGADVDATIDLINECARFLARVLASWDLVEDVDGPPVPLTEARLMAFGPFMIGALLASFIAGMRLGEPTGNGLPTPSAPTTPSRSRKSSRAS